MTRQLGEHLVEIAIIEAVARQEGGEILGRVRVLEEEMVERVAPLQPPCVEEALLDHVVEGRHGLRRHRDLRVEVQEVFSSSVVPER